MKKAWKIISTVFVWIVVVIAVAMMVFTIVSVNTFDRNDRDIFGYRCYIVLSDSMSATDFDAGDLVLVKKVDPTTLQEGDIIAYQSKSVPSPLPPTETPASSPTVPPPIPMTKPW